MSRRCCRAFIGGGTKIKDDRSKVADLLDFFLEEPRRYQDLDNSIVGISPNTLSDFLKRPEELGIIERKFYTDHPPRAEYHLTDKGKTLGPITAALRDWGRKHPK